MENSCVEHDILRYPTEWLIPVQALELARVGLEEAEVHVRQGNHTEAARCFSAVATGLRWQVMHQRALAAALAKEESDAE